MFRALLQVPRHIIGARLPVVSYIKCPPTQPIIQTGFARNFVSFLPQQPHLLQPTVANTQLSLSRNLIKFSFGKGKRKSVKAVRLRFYRLQWGGWIRTKCGRHKKLWKKSPPRKRRLRQHVFCNATQSTLLDKMVGPYWTKRRYYVEDPYEPYHSREEYQYTRAKPQPFTPPY